MQKKAKLSILISGLLLAIWGGATLLSTATVSAWKDSFELYLPILRMDGVSCIDEGRNIILDNGTVEVVVDKWWGGAIREIWWEGQNLINYYDGGRLVDVSLYDSDDPPGGNVQDPNWGWNPTPSDKYDHINLPSFYECANGTLYLEETHLHWNPDNKGGGVQTPVESDVKVEKWITLLPDMRQAIHIRYRITHLGSDSHALAGQELPFVYIRIPYNQFIYYDGNLPWTGGEVEIVIPPTAPNRGNSGATEYWGGFVNEAGEGLILWSPQAYSNVSYVYLPDLGAPEAATNYFVSLTFLGVEPGGVYEFETYLIAGHWQDAREDIYALHQSEFFMDVLPPFGIVDAPVANSVVSNNLEVAGWAIDNGMIAKVEIFLNGQLVAQTTTNIPRADVAGDYPGVPNAASSGFGILLDTTQFPNGSYELEVNVTDTTGNVSTLLPGVIPITIQNN